MKKIVAVAIILVAITAMSSCQIDDSNDIEIIKPGDTVITGKSPAKALPNLERAFRP